MGGGAGAGAGAGAAVAIVGGGVAVLCVGTFVVVILGKRTRRYVHTCFRRGRNKHRCPKSWVRVSTLDRQCQEHWG